jgi:glutamate/tyrosine decarboxylase-like PLP-dependent enzyme
MSTLEQQMSTSRSREAPLAMDAETFKVIGHQLVDQLAQLLASVPARPVTRDSSPSAVREALDLTGPLPEHGTDPAALLANTARQLFDYSLFNAHPRFFGYITAPPAPIGILGDFLASALNPNVGSRTLAPAATEIEMQTVRWIAELIGLPTDCGGLLVSGGNMANIVCLLAARVAAAPWDIRAKGISGGQGRQLLAYASIETHTWIQKAMDLCGLGTEAIRWIETGETLQMDVAALRRAIDADVAAGCLPFLVVGTAGSVSTGVADPLSEIAAVCREKGIWFHVDGAYGGFAAAAPNGPPELHGLREADSVAVDPHKWLYAPLEAGCALVRNREALRRAFTFHPPYYHFDDSAVNYLDYGLQNSRGFRALKVWLALRQVGASGYRRMIADDIGLSRAMADAIERHRELELMTQALSITTFRFVPTDLQPLIGETGVEQYLNDLNAALLDDLQRGGELFVSNAMIRGRYALRACIVNFHTSAADVEALPDIVATQGRMLDGRLRPVALAGGQ